MKSLSKILFHYLATAVLIVLSVLLFNVVLYVIIGFQIIRSTNFISRTTGQIASEISEEDGRPALSEEGYDYLEGDYSWAMLLDDAGNIVWQWQLPENLDHSYTVPQVSAFSKWYLDDYPVTTRVTDYGLLVTAHPRDTIWKYNVSESLSFLHKIPNAIGAGLICNLLFVVVLCLLLGFFFYRSLRSVAVGIERLSRQEAIRLPEKGMTELLARQLNQTSRILEQQKKHLQKRDDARTTWISGVSHDIRTPLSLIMGYADTLKGDPALSTDHRQQARLIEEQSLQIKQLIEDLNLTSKLEYDMQPLRLSSFSPAGLLREIVSGFYNQGLPDRYAFDLYIDPGVEKMLVKGDRQLILRAFRNLLHNSIRHNPQGCTVTVTAYPDAERICFQVSDDGCGIPGEIIRLLNRDVSVPSASEQPPGAPHIMGLRIVCQIFQAHGWTIRFTDNHTIHIWPGKEPEQPS